MRAWRFHRARYQPLDTTGSYNYGGRWNPRGVPVLYASRTFAGGLLELIAHATTPRHPPRDHVASLIDIPDEGGRSVLSPPYPPGWDHTDDFLTARRLADPWLQSGADLCLEVPSVPGAPIERNLVVNARHPHFDRLHVVETLGPVYDQRIWG